ncbi:hypothetical protein [Mycolicibacterium sp. 120270]|uniref:hypothetical protein n=1 Tax=Mycolicibacterium sp. 120270 TaxID=3090600 RepID=UPI00299D072C|nr:hypothetical protein [Mycolicibacterium sp. 120270]MDX1883046.1 hypothetical protein [Mycolicibacterium sp. 120270]
MGKLVLVVLGVVGVIILAATVGSIGGGSGGQQQGSGGKAVVIASVIAVGAFLLVWALVKGWIPLDN